MIEGNFFVNVCSLVRNYHRELFMAVISNQSQLRERASRVSTALQDIQDYLKDTKSEIGRIKFPRGFIRTASACRATLPNLKNDVLMKNISYTMMMTDVLRWLIIRTDINDVAKNMIIKTVIVLLVSVVEAFTKGVSKIVKGKIVGNYESRLNMLCEEKIISQEVKDILECAIRNKVHIPISGEVELSGYQTDDYNKILHAFRELTENLTSHFNK
jgi:hypothetical protein